MSDNINTTSFRWADIDRWVQQGLIEPDQMPGYGEKEITK